MLRISDFIKKIMRLNYYFSSRHVRKKTKFLVPLGISKSSVYQNVVKLYSWHIKVCECIGHR